MRRHRNEEGTLVGHAPLESNGPGPEARTLSGLEEQFLLGFT